MCIVNCVLYREEKDGHIQKEKRKKKESKRKKWAYTMMIMRMLTFEECGCT